MPRQPPKKRIRLEPSQTSQLQLALQSGILDNITAAVQANPAEAGLLILQMSQKAADTNSTTTATTSTSATTTTKTTTPQFCKCGNCVWRENKKERLCCRKGMDKGVCTLDDPELHVRNLVLDQDVVLTAVNAARDMYANDLQAHYNNDQMRHHAYRQWVYSSVGKTGAGNRVVVPACITEAIHLKWPSSHYTGHKPSTKQLLQPQAADTDSDSDDSISEDEH